MIAIKAFDDRCHC